MTERLLLKIIEIHDRNCPDRSCDPMTFAALYLKEAQEELERSTT